MNKTLQFITRPFRRQKQETIEQVEAAPQREPLASQPDFNLEPDDPLHEYFRANPSVTLLEKIQIESPALERLRAAGIKLVVPLVSQGELIGMLNLGPRLSEQDYSSDDIALLNNLAAQATPAVRVAQLVREQQEEAKERERMEQELRVARLIQQTLLPKELPNLPGWSLEAYYQPARAVGGDFYDFIELPDNQLGIFVGDVTDKGVPAALVMATTRRILRFAAGAVSSPGKVLEQANNLLVPDIPANMFVTCLYAVLEADSGRLRYANAGHNPPYQYGNGRTAELRARGMPLGLMPSMGYEERETVLQPGEGLLFYSDGLTEAHNPQREMFGFERVEALMAAQDHSYHSPAQTGSEQKLSKFIRHLLAEVEAFTGPGWEQEDDVTVVVLNHHLAGTGSAGSDGNARAREQNAPISPGTGRRLAAFEIPSEQGNERQAMRQVVAAVETLGLDQDVLERLKTAVAEATMNAMEHGNQFQAELPVEIEVWVSGERLSVTIRDRGGNQPIPEASMPDLDAKLAGMQSPRGWGLFLIEQMVDELRVSSDGTHHILELVIDLKGKQP